VVHACDARSAGGSGGAFTTYTRASATGRAGGSSTGVRARKALAVAPIAAMQTATAELWKPDGKTLRSHP